MDILKLAEEWLKQDKWIELDILRQRLDNIDDFCIKSNIAKKYHLSEENLKEAIEGKLSKKILDAVNKLSFKERESLLSKINSLMAEKEIDTLKKQISNLSDLEKRAVYMLSKMNLDPRTTEYIPWNELYKASYGIEPPFKVEDKLIELGYMYYEYYRSRKNSSLIYCIPPHILEFLKNIDSYIDNPMPINVKKVVERIKEEDIDKIIFLYGCMKGITSWPYLDEIAQSSYLRNIKPGLYFGDGRAIYFSPLYKDDFERIIIDEINMMIKDGVRIIEDIIDIAFKNKAIIQKIMPYYNPDWDGWATAVTDGIKVMSILAVPALMWSSYHVSPHVSFIQSQKNPLIIMARPITSTLLKRIYEKYSPFEKADMIILSTYDNTYFVKGQKPKMFDVFLNYAEKLGLKFNNITKEILDKVFPFDYEHIAEFIDGKYTYKELYALSSEYRISFPSNATTKFERIKVLIEKIGLTTVAKQEGYPNIPEIPAQEITNAEADIEEENLTPRIHTLNSQIKPQVSRPETKTAVPAPQSGIKMERIVIPSADRLKVFLGYTENQGKVFWEPGTLFTGHFIIVGSSGAGKTETIRCIASELSKQNFPVLMIDFHGDMACKNCDIMTYKIGENSEYYFNPLELDPQFEEITPLKAAMDFKDAVWINFPSIGIQQRDRLKEIIKEAYEEFGINNKKTTWVRELPFDYVVNKIRGSEDKIAQTLKGYVSDISDFGLFSGSKRISISDILHGKITHINLKPLPESLRNLYADLLLRKLYYSLQALGEIPTGSNIKDKDKFRVFVIIDEAKLLVEERQGVKAVLNKYVTEIRKYGGALILASQLITHFNDEILNNVATKLCMKVENKEEARRNSKFFGVDEETLLSLKQGEGILLISHRDRTKKVRIKVVPTWER